MTPWVPKILSNKFSYEVYNQNNNTRWTRVSGSGAESWTSKVNIPEVCKKALIAAEDTRFYQHFGIDLIAIKDSIISNYRNKRVRYGASTITQQIVKNALLSRTRSYSRKIRESLGAMFLDFLTDKEKQIAIYYNLIEFGPNVYGIKEASSYYFNKVPKDLSNSYLQSCTV